MGIGYCNRCKRYDGHDTNCPTVVGEPGEQQLRSRIEQLTARVRELEERRCEICGYAEHHREHTGCLRTQLAAEQLNNKLLRKALEAVIKVHGYESGIPVEALSLPASTEALDAYVANKLKESKGE